MPEGTGQTPADQPAGGTPPPHTAAPDKEPDGKGLSVLAWVGIGCGALVVLMFAGCMVTAYLGMSWLGGVVKDFEANPAMASARMIVRTNPELELVSSDDAAGTLTIRSRETGEVVTVDLDEIQEGRIRFESGGEEVTLGVEGSGAEGDGALTVKGKDGETQFRMGAGGDEEIPDWLPRYPDVDPTGTFFSRSGGEVNGTFSLQTEDSVEDVIAFYRQALEEGGFTETTYTTSQVQGGRHASLGAEAGNRRVGVVATTQGGATQVAVTFSESS